MPSGSTSRPSWTETRLEQHFGVQHVVVEAGGPRRFLLVSRRQERRHVLRLEVGKVGHETSLPQQMLAAGEVRQPRVAHVPPGEVAVEVRADVRPLETGFGVQPRLMHPEAQHVASQPFAERAVADVLHAPRIVDPVVRKRRERFGLTNRLAVNMRSAGDLLDRRVALPADGAIRLAVAFPELAHRHVVDAFALQSVDPVLEERPARLGMRAAQAALKRQFAQPAVVVGRHQVRRRPAVVLQESLRHRRIVDRLVHQRRQVRQRIVAPPPLELVAHRRGPGRLAQFPTVDVKVLQRLARQRPGVGDQLGPRLGKVGVHRRGAHRVDLQSARARADALDRVAMQRVADSQDVPRAGRSVPRQSPLLDP